MADHPVPTPARAPSEQEIEANREWALEAHSRLVGGIRQTRASLWAVAKELHEWDLRQGWKWTGNYETLGEWLADPEVAMTKGTYYRLRDGYRVLVVDKHVPENTVFELETSKVGVVLRSIREGDVDVSTAISDVETLSKSDLIEKYNPPKPDESTGGPSVNGSNDGVFDGTELDSHEPQVEDEEDEDLISEDLVPEVEAEDIIDGDSEEVKEKEPPLLLVEHRCGNRWWGDVLPTHCVQCQKEDAWKVVFQVEGGE
jgi:hypothetical protein